MSVFCRTLLGTFLFAGLAHADTLEVGTHPDSVTVKGSSGITKTIPVPLPAGGKRTSEQHTLPIGGGKQVVHVRITSGGQTWEAIVAGGANDPIWAGLTGYASGEEGERTGNIVLITDRDAGSKFVLVGDVREDTRICGQAMTPLSVRGLDPKTMQLRGASLHRIEKKERDAATPIVAAVSRAAPPLSKLLAATGGSSPGVAALTDGNPDTAWSEDRPGDGHGEFVTLAAPPEVPLKSLLVTPAATAPKTLFVATDTKLFQVTLPDDVKPGTTYEVPFPEPVKTACVAIVLDTATSDEASPRVSLGEVTGRSAFDADNATRADVVKALSGPRADEAAAMLRRGGDEALAAVVSQWPTLEAKARAFAVDIASSTGTCSGPAMDLLTRALPDADREVRRRALGRIERCGKKAAPALAEVVTTSKVDGEVAASATLLASIAPAQAFDPVVARLGAGGGSVTTRHSLRAALTRAAAVTSHEKLAAATTPNMDVLRGFGPALATVKPEAEAAIASLLAHEPDLATRYLAVEPIAAIGDTARLTAIIASDPAWPVRARAIELAGTHAADPSTANAATLDAVIAAAAADPEPRVREAAVRGMGANASQLLARDPWTFVRVAAAESLGKTGKDSAALAKALGDSSAYVRGAAVAALGKAHATNQSAAVYARLDDPKEDTDVRALAARTLGALCVQSAADRLTQLALLAKSPVDEADERLGMAALEGLGMLHPADIEKRLAPLRAKGNRTLLRRAADAAVSAPGACR